ncbi:MAG: hypothetical protein NUV82_03065 [Candidatus Komeilibacteria bacterium]|nr:hypothetical protein [Candidatus Komeilibacteria bacterium]
MNGIFRQTKPVKERSKIIDLLASDPDAEMIKYKILAAVKGLEFEIKNFHISPAFEDLMALAQLIQGIVYTVRDPKVRAFKNDFLLSAESYGDISKCAVELDQLATSLEECVTEVDRAINDIEEILLELYRFVKMDLYRGSWKNSRFGLLVINDKLNKKNHIYHYEMIDVKTFFGRPGVVMNTGFIESVSSLTGRYENQPYTILKGSFDASFPLDGAIVPLCRYKLAEMWLENN